MNFGNIFKILPIANTCSFVSITFVGLRFIRDSFVVKIFDYGMMIIVLQEGHKLNGYNSLLATVCKEDLKALKKLSSPWHAPEHFELTLSLVAGK